MAGWEYTSIIRINQFMDKNNNNKKKKAEEEEEEEGNTWNSMKL